MSALQAIGIETLELDVSKPKDIQNILAQVKEMTDGRLDVLVNNA